METETLRIVEPSIVIRTPEAWIREFPVMIEDAGRTAYKSHHRITEGSAAKFVRMIVRKGHTSVLEHNDVSVRVVCDRSTSHQIVRHRLNAFTQESQRYCDYGKVDKRDDDGEDGTAKLNVIIPPSIAVSEWLTKLWIARREANYAEYKEYRAAGKPPEDARSCLPNATKTEIVWTANVRQWRHIFDMRCDRHAQWQVRRLMTQLLTWLNDLAPSLFYDKAATYLDGEFVCPECSGRNVVPDSVCVCEDCGSTMVISQ